MRTYANEETPIASEVPRKMSSSNETLLRNYVQLNKLQVAAKVLSQQNAKRTVGNASNAPHGTASLRVGHRLLHQLV